MSDPISLQGPVSQPRHLFPIETDNGRQSFHSDAPLISHSMDITPASAHPNKKLKFHKKLARFLKEHNIFRKKEKLPDVNHVANNDSRIPISESPFSSRASSPERTNKIHFALPQDGRRNSAPHNTSEQSTSSILVSRSRPVSRGESVPTISSAKNHMRSARLKLTYIRNAFPSMSKPSLATLATITSESSAATIGNYQWKAEAKQSEIRLQQERIDSNPILSHYCQFFETALHGLWTGGDVFHPSQSGVERPEIGGPGIASILSAGVENGLGYVVESVTLEMAAEALKVVPGGAGKMVESLLTMHHQRKNNQLNVKFSESVLPSKRDVMANTLARAVTEARSDRIIEVIGKKGDTSTFMKWMKVICADTIGRYIEGTLSADESPEMRRIRTLAWHDAFEFLLAQVNPVESGMFAAMPGNISAMEEVLPFQLEWLDLHLASDSTSGTAPARTVDDYRKFVKPGVLSGTESMALQNEPAMKRLFTDNGRLWKTVKIEKKFSHRLQLDLAETNAALRHLQSNRTPPGAGSTSAGGNAATAAINAFLRCRSTVSHKDVTAYMTTGDASMQLKDMARYLDEVQGEKTRHLHIGFFTPSDGIAKLKQALKPIISRDVEAHPGNEEGYRRLENALASILQSAIDGRIDYEDAKRDCRRVVKEHYGAGTETKNSLGDRFKNAIDKVFHDIREGIDRHEDALYALNAYLPRQKLPACQQFIVRLRHGEEDFSTPFCFLCDDKTGQWFVLGGPGSGGQEEPQAISPRAYFEDLVFGGGKHKEVRGIEVLVPDQPFNPLIRLQERILNSQG